VCDAGKLLLPKSLLEYAALLSHGPRHVSTGGMVAKINKDFTVYGFINNK